MSRHSGKLLRIFILRKRDATGILYLRQAARTIVAGAAQNHTYGTTLMFPGKRIKEMIHGICDARVATRLQIESSALQIQISIWRNDISNGSV